MEFDIGDKVRIKGTTVTGAIDYCLELVPLELELYGIAGFCGMFSKEALEREDNENKTIKHTHWRL